MFVLGWLPRVFAIDSRLINFIEGLINCIASDISQQCQEGDFTHRSCQRSLSLGEIEEKEPFSLPLQ